MKHVDSRRTVGERIGPIELETLSHGLLTIPRRPWTHLQFRRFSGCPICNLHLREFSRRYDELRALGGDEVVFFHSSASSMARYQSDLPFLAVPDPERVHYREFKVESSFSAMLDHRAAWAVVQGLMRPRANPLSGGPNPNGLPAEFLLDEAGTIVDLKYGAHADDQWSFDEVLDRVKRLVP